MTDCPRLGRWVGGCNFKPRYDTVSATGPTKDDVFWLSAMGVRSPSTPARKTYLGDVCETCGKMLFKRRLVSPPQGPAAPGGGVGRGPTSTKGGA